jgi:adenosylcobyric acid synthase
MRDRGLDEWVIAQHRRGATVIGVCGGYQMLGRAIHDPNRLESEAGSVSGHGLITAETTLARDKTTRVVSGSTSAGAMFDGYEIHLGSTTSEGTVTPFARLQDGTSDGVRGNRVIGTYLHGALESAAVCAEIFGVPIAPPEAATHTHRRLAEWFETHVRSMEVLGLS